MDDVATAAEDDLRARARELGGGVEERAAARRQDVAVVERGGGDLRDTLEQRVYGAALAHHALEALHPDRREVARAGRRVEHPPRVVVLPRAAAPARDADLGQHLDLAPGGVQRLDARDRVDQAVELGVRLAEPADRAAVEHLVGDQDPAHAVARHHLRLADGRRRHAPRAGGELVGEQLRRHRRLAVGRERDAVLVAEAPHAREVVAQAVAAQRQRGEQEVAGPQRQPELADAPERHVGQRVRQPLGADADGLGQEGVEPAHPRSPPRSWSSTSS
jgi:hypothetical protein